MATADDEMKEDPVFSLLLDSLNSNLNDEALSPEEVAWADSCLNKDVGASDTDWNSVRDALLEILSAQPGEPDSTGAESIGPTVNNEILHSISNVESLEFRRGSDEDEDLMDDYTGETESLGSSEEEEEEEEDFMLGRRKARGRGKARAKGAFQPHYTEEIVKDDIPDSVLDTSLTMNELETSSEDLFKVWDLEIPDEEDEFTAELNKALSGNSPPEELIVDDPTPLSDVVNVSVDDLIAGVGDLSLEQDIK